MTDAGFDRRLRGWLDERDPGPVPSALRASITRVPVETPVPLASRLLRPIVGPRWAGQESVAVRLVLILVLVGLLIVAVVTVSGAGGRPRLPTGWRDYVVGQPAPDRDFSPVAGALAHGDATISVDDFQDNVVVLYFSADASAEQAASDARGLVSASARAPTGTAFLIVTRAMSPLPPGTIASVRAAGMRAAQSPADWDADGRGSAGPVLVITDRGGVVDQIYTSRIPDTAELIGDLDRAAIP